MIKMAKSLRLSFVLTRHYLKNATKTAIFPQTNDIGHISLGTSLTSTRKYCSRRDKKQKEEQPSSNKRPVPVGGSFMSGKLRYKNRHSEPFPLDKVDEILHDLHKKNLIDTNEILTTGPSPFEQEVRKCILCTKRIELDYKNVRLLNQFISSKTGVMFQRESTGLCIPMYNRIKELIQRSRAFGLMPYLHGVPEFNRDGKMVKYFKKTQRVEQSDESKVSKYLK